MASFTHLLSESIKYKIGFPLSRYCIFLVNVDVIIHTAGWVKSYDSCRTKQLLVEHIFQHPLCFIEELLGFFTCVTDIVYIFQFWGSLQQNDQSRSYQGWNYFHEKVKSTSKDESGQTNQSFYISDDGTCYDKYSFKLELEGFLPLPPTVTYN